MKKNVTLDRTTVLQLDADGTDGALDAITLRASDLWISDGAQVEGNVTVENLAFDSAKDLRWTFAFDVVDRRELSV